MAELDTLRGLIMVLMALDHACYFVAKAHSQEFWGTEMPYYAVPLEFLTRLATHICAPGFFFLMGVSVVMLAAARERSGWSAGQIVRFLVVRGVALILLQLFVENPGWDFGDLSAEPGIAVVRGGEFPGGGAAPSVYFGVLYALGGALILCSFLVTRPDSVIVIASATAFAVSQWVVAVASPGELYTSLARLFLIPGHTDWALVFYPILPWFGIAGFGMVFGRGLLRNARRTYAIGSLVGLACLALFLVDRLAWGFGDFHTVPVGWIGFFNTTKYPPSLDFVLMTLGPDLVILALFAMGSGRLGRWTRPLIVFGQSALFFYIVHLYVYSLIGFAFPRGTSILELYVSWIAGLLILYPLCYWYGRFKQRRPIESVWRYL